MTGLDLARDALIEVAAIVTDAELNPLDDGVEVVIHAADDLIDTMVPVVRDMHSASGLTEAVRASTTTLGDAERLVLEYVKSHVTEARTAPLCGNSIGTDRGFVARDMPALDEFLHYRMIDVSSIKELAKRWYPRVYQSQPEKGLRHRALRPPAGEFRAEPGEAAHQALEVRIAGIARIIGPEHGDGAPGHRLPVD